LWAIATSRMVIAGSTTGTARSSLKNAIVIMWAGVDLLFRAAEDNEPRRVDAAMLRDARSFSDLRLRRVFGQRTVAARDSSRGPERRVHGAVDSSLHACRYTERAVECPDFRSPGPPRTASYPRQRCPADAAHAACEAPMGRARIVSRGVNSSPVGVQPYGVSVTSASTTRSFRRAGRQTIVHCMPRMPGIRVQRRG
jgi:hypothetical protein